MKLTTGVDFQGYFITEYLDVIFDEMLVGIGFGRSVSSAIDNIASAFLGTEATEIMDALEQAKSELRNRVIRKAERLGANALIGIDFESSHLGDLVMVSMTATAVKIEKIIRPLPYTVMDKAIEESAQEHKGSQRQAEEKRRALLDNPSFDGKKLLDVLEDMKTAQEMSDYMTQVSEQYPGAFDESIFQQIKTSVNTERLYGKGTGTESIIKAVKQYCNL